MSRRQLRNRALILLLLAAAAWAAPLRAAEPTYVVTVLTDEPTAWPGAVNSAMPLQAVGRVTVDGLPRAYVITEGGALRLLPLTPGTISSQANDINDRGIIVGFVSDTILAESGFAVAWIPNGRDYDVLELGALPGNERSSATAVNNRGDIVGFSLTPGFMSGPPVLFTHPDGILNLVDFGFFNPPADLSNRRVVVGGTQRMDLDDLILEDLGAPKGYFLSFGAGVNERNQVAAGIVKLGGGEDDTAAGRFSDATGWEVLTPDGALNTAFSIDESGTVTVAFGVGAARPLGVYFDGLGLRTLEDLIPPDDPGWFLLADFGAELNDRGQIVTSGGNTLTGEGGVLLLTPRVPLTAEASGGCPGEVTVSVDGAIPGSRVNVLVGPSTGSSVIGPNRACAGVDVGLDQPRVLARLVTDETGRASFSRAVGAAACGRPLRAVDLPTCTLSDLQQIPQGVDGARLGAVIDVR